MSESEDRIPEGRSPNPWGFLAETWVQKNDKRLKPFWQKKEVFGRNIYGRKIEAISKRHEVEKAFVPQY